MAVMLQNEWDVTVYVSGYTRTHYSCSKVLLKHKENHALFLQIYSVSSDMKEVACLYGFLK